MKPFDLEATLGGERAVTRDRRAFRLAGVNRAANPHVVIAGWVDGSLYGWEIDGRDSLYSLTVTSPLDLFMVTGHECQWCAGTGGGFTWQGDPLPWCDKCNGTGAEWGDDDDETV